MSGPQIENRFAFEADDCEAELNRRWQARDDRYLAAFETSVEACAAARGITVPIVVTGEADLDRTFDAAHLPIGWSTDSLAAELYEYGAVHTPTDLLTTSGRESGDGRYRERSRDRPRRVGSVVGECRGSARVCRGWC